MSKVPVEIDWPSDIEALQRTMVDLHGWRVDTAHHVLGVRVVVLERQKRGPLGRFRRNEYRVLAAPQP